jgi:predicted nucleotidyltransferase
MSEPVKMPPTLDDLRARRKEILEIAAQYGASNVRVVGSVARHEATPTSDVDLLMTISSRRSVFDLVGLWLDLKELLGCDVSIIPDSASDERFMQSVLEDAVPL